MPYIVIFCRAIEASSPLYLKKLASVVNATEKAANTHCDTYGKQLAIFRLMYDVACKWVEARNPGSGTGVSEAAITVMTNLPRLSAGTFPNSSLEFNQPMCLESLEPGGRHMEGEQPGAMPGMNDNALGDWMDQNYQIFQMLDDDAFFSY